MKTKYLDIRNCRALIGKAADPALLADFEKYLEEVNSESDYSGLINRLVERNQNSHEKEISWFRLYKTPVDLLIDVNFETGQRWFKINDYSSEIEAGRTELGSRALLQVSFLYPTGTRWTYKVPLQSILKGWGDADKGYQGYVHTISYGRIHDQLTRTDASGREIQEMHYVGITGRDWLKRLEEHMSEMTRGGGKLFHRAWRKSLTQSSIVYTSELMLLNATKEYAFDWEEDAVDAWSLAPKGFNMIPGGLKGLQFLHKHRITDSLDISLAEREAAIAEYVRTNPRKGIPNPFMSELWEDDEFYRRVIEAREKTLTANQVRQIRRLDAAGWEVAAIVKEVRALNEQQVKNVIAGRTYKRIH